MEELFNLLNGFNAVSVTFRVLLATLVGGCIGSERGRHGRAAGLRTHILVCLGATMTALVGLYASLTLGFDSDPLRVGAQVISGIGFLGAGTILTRNRSQVLGLTTAAALWTTASLGLAIGVGFYWGAVIAFVLMMVTITILTKLERASKQPPADTYYVELSDATRVNDLSDQLVGSIAHLHILPPKSGIPAHVGLEFCVNQNENSDQLLHRLREMVCVVIAVPMSN